MQKSSRAPGRTVPLPVALSALFMGLGQITVQRQYVKGLLFAAVEVLFLVTLPTFFQKISGLITLGEPHPELPVKLRDNSIFMMIEGIVFLALLLFVVFLYVMNLRDARKTEARRQQTGAYPTTRAFLSSLGDSSFAVLGLSPVIVLLVFFVIIPLLFSALIAFTNYSSPDHIPPAKTVDWVGFQNFRDTFALGDWGAAFLRTATWSLAWAFLSTATCYAGGTLAALALSDKKIRLPGFFRSVFVLPYAIPGMVSLMVWKNLLNGSFGPVNRLLREWGLIAANIPWLSDATLARMSCVLVNLWLGFPYFMLLITGTLTSIPGDLYEAASIDGATKRVQFFRITLPLVLYQTVPLIIMSFSHNLNNFGAVFFLTEGNPSDTLTTQTGAGATDLLISWMYNLTYDHRLYNRAAVLSILIFLVVAPFAIYNFSRTKAFREGEL